MTTQDVIDSIFHSYYEGELISGFDFYRDIVHVYRNTQQRDEYGSYHEATTEVGQFPCKIDVNNGNNIKTSDQDRYPEGITLYVNIKIEDSKVIIATDTLFIDSVEFMILNVDTCYSDSVYDHYVIKIDKAVDNNITSIISGTYTPEEVIPDVG